VCQGRFNKYRLNKLTVCVSEKRIAPKSAPNLNNFKLLPRISPQTKTKQQKKHVPKKLKFKPSAMWFLNKLNKQSFIRGFKKKKLN